MREIMAIADSANRYIDEMAPWKLAREAGNEQKVIDVCSMGINLFRVLMTYLKPVLPAMAKTAEDFLNCELAWQDDFSPLLDHDIKPFKPMMQRVDNKKVDAMLEDNKQQQPQAEKTAGKTEAKPADAGDKHITIDDFLKVDLRIAKIVNAETVEGADKLLRLTLDVGELGQREVLSGIRAAYEPDDLIGMLTVLVANLKPRKMKFGTSEGMVLAAGPGGKDIWLLEPHAGATAGMQVG